MPRWVFFIGFFLTALLVLGGVHYYFYRRFVIDTALPPPWRAVGLVIVAVLVLSFPISFGIGRALGVSTGRIFLFPAYVWLGIMMLLFVTWVGADLLRGAVWLGSRSSGHHETLFDPGRRLFVARTLAAAVAGTAVISAGVAMRRGLGRVVVKRLDIRLRNLPAAFDGFRILQLTDLHLSAMRQGAWVRELVDRSLALGPDLIAITGDLADATPEALAREVEMLAELRAPHGVYFVTGNHEYFIDLEGWLATLERIGVRLLRNERVELSRDGAAIDLAGIDDHDGARLAPGHGPDLNRALAGRDPERAVVLLAHQPRIITPAAEQGVGLVLSGHTHGGQIWPWGYAVYLQQPFIRGLHRRGDTQIYVSEGTGFWGPPMRLASTAEMTLVTLRPESPAP